METIKNIFLKILVPLAFISGIIYYIVLRVLGIKVDAEMNKNREELAQVLHDKEVAKNETDDRVAAYKRALDEYNKSRGN